MPPGELPMPTPHHADRVRALFDGLADGYENRYPGPTDHLDEFADLLPAKGRVLDVGCGTGKDSAHLAGRGLFVTGVDLSAEMVRRARALHPGLSFEVADMQHLPFPPRSFDGILAAFSLIFLPDEDVVPALRRLHDLLVADGVLFVVVQEGEQDSTGVPLIFSNEGLIARLRAAGFEPERDHVREPRPHERPTRKRYVMARRSAASLEA